MTTLAKVTVRYARGLASMDSNGFSDPYALLFLNGKKHKTRTIMKTLDPTWEAAFSYTLTPGATNLYIQVWDWDRASTDDFLGECYVDLQEVGDNPAYEIPLKPQPGKEEEQSYVTGTITIGVELNDPSTAGSLSASAVNRMRGSIKHCLDTHDTALDLSGCSLPGLPKLVCERLNFVTTLDLSLNKVALFPDLSRFSVLEELNLTGNLLAELPEEIGTATTLRVLILNGNVLKSLPHSIGKLVRLEKLEANNNELTTLPKDIGRLSMLEELSLSGNPLAELPEAVGAMRNLHNLDLSCCRLTSIPEALTLTTRMLDLNIGGNQLQSLPDGIGRMTRLVSLNVQDNKLTDLPVTIGLCSCLGQIGYGINLARNPITDQRMLEEYRVGADHLMDYLEKRYAMNNNPMVPPCPIPSDLGEGPLPQWILDEQERQRRLGNLQAVKGPVHPQQPAAPSAASAPDGSAQQAATSPAIEQKLAALRTWAQTTTKEIIRPSFANFRTLVRTSGDLKELLDVAYKLARLNEEFATVSTIAPFVSKGPANLSPEMPQCDQLRVYTLAAINYVDSGVRAVLLALDKCSSQQMANVVLLCKVLNAIKTSLQQQH